MSPTALSNVEEKNEAAEQFLLKNTDLLRRFLRIRLKNSQDVEDVLHEVYLRLRQSEGFRIAENPMAYMLTAAANASNSYYRRQKTDHALKDAVSAQQDNNVVSFFSNSSTQENHVFSLQWQQRFLFAVQELPPKRRRVFLMNRIEHKSYTEIARELGISVTMVERQISKALTHCRNRLADFLSADGKPSPHAAKMGLDTE